MLSMLNANNIVAWSRKGGRLRRRVAQVLLILLFSFDLPPEVEVGTGVVFLHNCLGSVIHPKTVIRDGALICQGVTIGDANMHHGPHRPNYEMKGIVIGENASICAGAKVLCRDGILTVGGGTVIGANSVLTESTGENEVWIGIPAHPRRRYH